MSLLRTRGRAASAAVAAALGGALLGSLACLPATAAADSMSELQEAQSQVAQATEDYEAATARVEELEDQIAQNEGRVEELEAQLPALRERAAASMRILYKMQQGSGGLVELLLASDDFSELVATIQYLDIIQSDNTDSVSELLAAQDELQIAQTTLNSQLTEAQSQRDAASEALAQAQAARSQLQAQIAAQAEAERDERQAAVEAAKKAQAQAQQQAEESGEPQKEPTFTTESGNQAEVETPTHEDPGTVDTSSDKDSFVAEWSARINAYLAGSPLAGQGETFAEAAWEYGVDPRLSPAISQVESSKGRYCFLPHNAWGWGSSSWSNWHDAIWEHVQGLAIGYGGQLTYAGAKKYCPPNADFWYSTVLANMEMI